STAQSRAEPTGAVGVAVAVPAAGKKGLVPPNHRKRIPSCGIAYTADQVLIGRGPNRNQRSGVHFDVVVGLDRSRAAEYPSPRGSSQRWAKLLRVVKQSDFRN